MTSRPKRDQDARAFVCLMLADTLLEDLRHPNARQAPADPLRGILARVAPRLAPTHPDVADVCLRVAQLRPTPKEPTP